MKRSGKILSLEYTCTCTLSSTHCIHYNNTVSYGVNVSEWYIRSIRSTRGRTEGQGEMRWAVEEEKRSGREKERRKVHLHIHVDIQGCAQVFFEWR